MLKYLRTLFEKQKCRQGSIYAVLHGTHAGQYVVLINSGVDAVTLFSLPSKEILNVPNKDFFSGLNNKIIDFIEVLPKFAYKLVEDEFLSINNNNGLRTTSQNSKPHKRANSASKNNNIAARIKDYKRSSLD